jgi:hypothetical protein
MLRGYRRPPQVPTMPAFVLYRKHAELAAASMQVQRHSRVTFAALYIHRAAITS